MRIYKIFDTFLLDGEKVAKISSPNFSLASAWALQSKNTSFAQKKTRNVTEMVSYAY